MQDDDKKRQEKRAASAAQRLVSKPGRLAGRQDAKSTSP